MVSAADDSRSDSRYARDTSTGFSSPDDMHRRAESVPVRRALPRGPLPPIHATSTAADTRCVVAVCLGLDGSRNWMESVCEVTTALAFPLSLSSLTGHLIAGIVPAD